MELLSSAHTQARRKGKHFSYLQNQSFSGKGPRFTETGKVVPVKSEDNKKFRASDGGVWTQPGSKGIGSRE